VKIKALTTKNLYNRQIFTIFTPPDFAAADVFIIIPKTAVFYPLNP